MQTARSSPVSPSPSSRRPRLSVSTDSGCTWEFFKDGPVDRIIADLSIEPVDPSRAVLLVSSGVGSSKYLTQVWQSADNGATWTQAGIDLPDTFLGFTIHVAPSDTTRVYVGGRYGAPDYIGAIQRSKDRGATWESLAIPGTDSMHLPYLGAVDPSNPDRLFLRIDGDPVDSVLVSEDGGDTWSTAFESTGNLLGFALSPDGADLFVGGSNDGLWRAPTSSLAFEKVSDIHVRCLTAADSVLYACTEEFTDGFAVGVSTSKGSTWEPIMHLNSPCGPIACGEQTSVGAQCTDAWGATQLTIGAKSCQADAGPTPAPAPRPPPEGCRCRAAGAAGPGAARGGAAGVALVAWTLARRRMIRASRVRYEWPITEGAAARAPVMSYVWHTRWHRTR